jgi:GDP-L-fucose synthase
MEKNELIYVAGHRGMVGSAIVRRLREEGFTNLVLRTSAEMDLRRQAAVEDFFETHQPAYVFLAAAKVGGILANDTYRAEFLYDNLAIQTNVIHSAWKYGARKLLFLGSSCIYPRLAPQPLREDYLLTGELESTNEPYAIAKIAGIKMCDAYRSQYGFNAISAMPTNLYGPNDNYDLQHSHVIPGLLRKFHEAMAKGAPEVVVWGSGSPMREFLHVDDLADACLFLMDHWDQAGFVNVGAGLDISIRDLAVRIREIVGFQGTIRFDTSKPDGTPRKLMDVSRLHALGWHHSIILREGLTSTYQAMAAKWKGAS